LQKPFIVNPKDEISFVRLYKKCVALAGFLQEKYGTGKRILVISHNNVFFITSYLAILKSGNIVVPINPEMDQKNLDYIINHCEADTAFVSKAVKISSGYISDVYNEDSIAADEIVNFSGSSPAGFIGGDNTAGIIFTSGSTGEPKGVELTHENLIANTSSIVSYLNLTRDDRMLVVLPFYYCYGLSLLHTHLRAGGSIVLNNSFIFIGGIFRDLKQYNCTGFAGVPSHYQILVRKSKSFVTSVFPDLRYVTQAGGKLPAVFIQEFTSAFPAIDFYVMYGQTEATARLSFLPPSMLPEKLGSIGKGIPGVTLLVVNEHGSACKPGEPGEIIAKGDNIMKGYFRDEQLTSETIRNGFLYTGDLAITDDEGYIYITSRKKDFIKVGGKRVSPKEIEEVILLMPEVVDCTVTGVSDDLLGEAMKATIVLSDDKREVISRKDVQVHCQKNLPLFKIPTFIEFEDSLKVNAAGKKTKN
jgi:acyl-CoA synthetase (AMP-forming)/AMP-acid ligase II